MSSILSLELSHWFKDENANELETTKACEMQLTVMWIIA